MSSLAPSPRARAEAFFAVMLLASLLLGTIALAGCRGEDVGSVTREETTVDTIEKLIRTEEEWKRILPTDRYEIIRQKGTERPFTGEYDEFWEDGVYACYACELPLFDSSTKFHSGSGWPSFWQPIAPQAVEETEDSSYGMSRTEVTCARCGGHLGHVFDDGPQPTGLRYCINSASLTFVPR
jgi:peptide-methionine (R)-S-oxide reductase